MRRSAGVGALHFAGSRMGMSQVGLPTRTKVDPAFRRPLDLSARLQCAPGRLRVVRMPSDWWDSPAVAACPPVTGRGKAVWAILFCAFESFSSPPPERRGVYAMDLAVREIRWHRHPP